MKYESVLLLTYDTLEWISIQLAFRDIWIFTRITKTTK